MKANTLKSSLFLTGLFTLFTCGANAAVVSFASTQLAADGSNTLTDGSVHTSVTYGSAGNSRVINGVDWNELNSGLHDNPTFKYIDNRNAGNTFYNSAGAGLAEATNDIIYNPSMTVGINGLTIGQQYRIQVISFDSVLWNAATTAVQLRQQTVSASSAGDSGTLDFQQYIDGTVTASQEAMRASLITGTWTADSTTIDFTFAARTGNDNAILNAFVVQAIPEPSSAALLGLSALALSLILRRRK